MTPALKSVAILAASGALVLGSMVLSRGAAPQTTPVPAGVADDARFLSALPESSHTLRGSSELHVAVSIQAPAHTATVRPPISVAIVLDRSGSMEGGKLVQAKRAAIELISSLSPTDRFSVTTYGTDVKTILGLRPADAASIAGAIPVIESIEDMGGTNLSGGLVAGRNELAAHADDGVRRIVLISDGRANEGIVYKDQLAQLARDTAATGISITTVGIGLDFEEQTMTAIAVGGRGNYYFAENASDLSSMFRTEVGRVTATSATDIALRFASADGVELLEAYGHTINDGIIGVADLHAGETRRVVLKLRTRFATSGTKTLGTVHLTMNGTSSGESISENVALSVVSTDDFHAVNRGGNPEAIAMVERARTAVAIEQATGLYEKGDKAGATRMLQIRRAQAAKRAASIGDSTLRRDMDKVATDAEDSFASEPSSDEGKSARKRNRNKTYEMLH